MRRRSSRATGAHAARPTTRRRAAWAVGVSWALTILVSALPLILSLKLTGAIPTWLTAAQVTVAAVTLVLALVFTPLRGLWRYATVVGVLVLLLNWSAVFRHAIPFPEEVFGGTPFAHRMLAEQLGKLVIAGLMIVLLLAIGLRPRDFFLRIGNLSAPIRPVRILGFPRADSWVRFGLIWAVGIAIVLALAHVALLRPAPQSFVLVLPMAPSIIVFAALNACTEEITYRAPLLATLAPVVGAGPAVWQTAFFFGVAHYFGVPGGLAGAALSIFMGWILSKAMVETRGLFWPWLIHFLADIVIFAFLALTLSG